MTSLGTEVIVIALATSLAAGFVHGCFGLGFPFIVTPVLALVTDVKTAILLTLAPNIAVNVWSVLRGGGWWRSVARFWPVALAAPVGAALGTLLLVALDPNPFRLLLAATIVLYLVSHRLERVDWSWIRRHPRGSGVGAGLGSGLLGGTVNVGGPVLMIYFLELRVAPLMMVQGINLCFLFSKGTQAATFALLGELGLALLSWSLLLAVAALAGLRAGMAVREHMDPEAYRGWLRGLLWGLCTMLVVQFFRDL